MRQEDKIQFRKIVFVTMILLFAGFGIYNNRASLSHVSALAMALIPHAAPVQGSNLIAMTDIPAAPTPVVTHLPTPSSVQGIYISGWSAGTKSSMDHIYDLLSGGKINSVIIDIKDATGKLSYEPLDPALLASGVGTKRIANLSALIQTLHDKHIYVIGRVAVFQDPYYSTIHPEAGLHSIATGEVWKDPKGIAWLNPNNPQVWHYIESIGEDAYAQGFDEINVDYVRYPSDGTLKDIQEVTPSTDRSAVITNFFTDLDTRIRGQDHIPLSADIFGLTVSATDDMGIGQKLDLIAPHVDYICPMIYPSHFADGSYGFKNPADHPYDIIHKALTDAVAKLTAANISTDKLRPWLQDFNLGAIYTPQMVQEQITATNDVAIQSWSFWDAKNLYTSSVLK